MTRPGRFLFVVCVYMWTISLTPTALRAQSADDRLFKHKPAPKHASEVTATPTHKSAASGATSRAAIDSLVSRAMGSVPVTGNLNCNPSRDRLMSTRTPPTSPNGQGGGMPMIPWQPPGQQPPGQQPPGIAPPGNAQPVNPLRPANRPDFGKGLPRSDRPFSPGMSGNKSSSDPTKPNEAYSSGSGGSPFVDKPTSPPATLMDLIAPELNGSKLGFGIYLLRLAIPILGASGWYCSRGLREWLRAQDPEPLDDVPEPAG